MNNHRKISALALAEGDPEARAHLSLREVYLETIRATRERSLRRPQGTSGQPNSSTVSG